MPTTGVSRFCQIVSLGYTVNIIFVSFGYGPVKKIYDRLNWIENHFNLTTEKISDIIRCRRNQYSKYKRGEVNIPEFRLQYLEAELGVRAEWVQFGKEPVMVNHDEKLKSLNESSKLLKKLHEYGVLNHFEKLPENPSERKKRALVDFLDLLSQEDI